MEPVFALLIDMGFVSGSGAKRGSVEWNWLKSVLQLAKLSKLSHLGKELTYCEKPEELKRPRLASRAAEMNFCHTRPRILGVIRAIAPYGITFLRKQEPRKSLSHTGRNRKRDIECKI